MGNFQEKKGRTVVKCSDSRPRAVQKWLNLIKTPFGLWTRVDPRKHVLGGVHTSATWWILLNRPCAAAMRPFCQITLTTCLPGVAWSRGPWRSDVYWTALTLCSYAAGFSASFSPICMHVLTLFFFFSFCFFTLLCIVLHCIVLPWWRINFIQGSSISDRRLNAVQVLS